MSIELGGLCRHCFHFKIEHVKGHCLFGPTTFDAMTDPQSIPTKQRKRIQGVCLDLRDYLNTVLTLLKDLEKFTDMQYAPFNYERMAALNELLRKLSK